MVPGDLCLTGLPTPCNLGRVSQVTLTCKPINTICY
jgi:hypothetical protein